MSFVAKHSTFTEGEEHVLIFPLGKVRYLLGGRGVGGSILEFFCEKSRSPPTSWNGLMHDPSEIPKQKHLTLPPYLSKTKISGSENNKLEVLLI